MTDKRVKKNKSSSKKNNENVLSEEQVWNVLEFANSIYSGLYPNVFTPDLINSRMKDVTMQPQIATMDKITSALSTPKQKEEELIGYSQWMELNSILYKRVLLYFSGLMSFDWTYVATNIRDSREYKSNDYKDDLLLLQEFSDKFDVKEQFKVALKEMLRNETFFGVFRDDGSKYVIQELPRGYCKITGRFDYGLVFDFNMNWFLQGGVSLDMYPKSMKRMYRDLLTHNDSKYNPAGSPLMRDGTWAYWVQTNPRDGFVAFKLFPEIGTNIPFLAPYMPDAIMQPIVRSLQLNNYIADASKLISGQVPFLKDSKASVKDALAIDPNTLGKFLSLLKSSLPDIIKIVSAPLENISTLEFKGNEKLYDSYLSTASSSAGINSRLIYGKDRQNVLETKLSMDVDQNILRPVYHAFENMFSFWVNQKTKKYKFKFLFEGFNTAVDREERVNNVMKYAESGMVLEQKFATALGMNVFDFRRQLEEGRSNDFVKNLTPILKASQISSKDGTNGRPMKSDGDLSDSGAETRDDGSNDEKGEE